MAAYAATVTLDFPHSQRIGNSAIGVMSGSCDLTNYNTTQSELTAITRKFRSGGILRVIGEVSSNGYVIKWNGTSLAFEAYRVDQVDDPLEEAPDDTAVGTFGFVIIGQL